MTATSKITSNSKITKTGGTPAQNLYKKKFITPLRGAVYEMAQVDIEVRPGRETQVMSTQQPINQNELNLLSNKSHKQSAQTHPNYAKDEKRDPR